MEMTAPVRQSVAPRGRREVKVSFLMSKKRTLGSLPVPRDAKVKLRSVPAHFAAFKRFNGPPPTDAVVAKKEAVVLKALAETGGVAAVRPVAGGETLVYGYHDPFLVPSLLRRNEVGVMVEGPGAK
ncbi:SOUL hem-binding protein [Pavlovales sp. CCMP2436]|nr:SOUL hem-binding protein [Pavlovales sp. CCMP2436]